MSASRSGFSLLELLVVLVILALVAGVVGATWSAPQHVHHPVVDSVARAALAEARVLTVRDSTQGYVVCSAAYPDGRIISDSGAGVQ